MRVLLCEDDRDISAPVRRRLESEHCVVDLCETGPDAFDYITMTPYDVILMDIMLPDEDGLSVVRRARAAGVHTPILFLTARDSVADRVMGLDIGGDDYLVKPFALDELMARVRVLVRRRGDRTDSKLSAGDLVLDTASHTVTRAGRSISLTSREYMLLEYLLRNKGVVVTREQIEQNLFNYDYMGASNMVDVYIRYLRRKLDDGDATRLIHTVRGVGYVLREDA